MPMPPLRLHRPPEMEDGQVLGQKVELKPGAGLQLAISGKVCKPSQANATLAPWLMVSWVLLWLLLLVFGVIACDLAGRQQLGQPPQFPDLPRAPLAWR